MLILVEHDKSFITLGPDSMKLAEEFWMENQGMMQWYSYLAIFLPFMKIVCNLIGLWLLYIANNMDPDQTAP